jgi:ABC-2 type transport system ATP-binding protein
MSPAILQVENLAKSYGGQVAVKNVSLQVEAGEIYGLLGPNGAGKTTTLRCICTLAQPDSGIIRVVGETDPRKIRDRLGYVAQAVSVDKVLTGRELLRLHGAMYHLSKQMIAERIEAVLELLQLQEYADRRTGTYSGGLQKRLDLAAGLLHQPQLLVLDEPTVGLDVQTRIAIWDFLRSLKDAGVAVLITSHYLEEIDALADRVAIIDRGKIIAEGTPSQLKENVGGDRVTLKISEFAELKAAEQTLNLLQNLTFIRSSSINSAQGNAINLVIDANADASAQIQTTLREQEISIFSISQSRPSLDDVFLAATGQTILDAEIAQAELAPKKKK